MTLHLVTIRVIILATRCYTYRYTCKCEINERGLFLLDQQLKVAINKFHYIMLNKLRGHPFMTSRRGGGRGNQNRDAT